METTPTVIFSYKIDDILEEITKRTSYFGKMRGTETEPVLIDRLSLTSGENFMFTEFLQDSVTQVYDWLKAFGRKIKYSNKCDITYNDIAIYKDHGVWMYINGGMQEFGKWITIGTSDYKDNEDGTVSLTCDEISVERMKEDVNVVIDFRYVVHSLLDGLDCDTPVTDRKVFRVTSGNSFSSGILAFECKEHDSYHQIYRIDMEVKCEVFPLNVVPIKKGDYVECRTDFGDDSIFDVYQVVEDCTNENWTEHADKLEYDPRESIVFMLERTSHFDENMIFSVDRNIKEALINYIIYRWFEFVNEVEADKFYIKYEDYAYKAKMGMESETKPVQRRYKLF
jgi:hypothetical protein